MTSPIVITGHLRADAEHRRTAQSGSLVSLELRLPASAGRQQSVARVVHAYGTGEAAAFAAGARAKRLRTGVRVTVHALACELRRGVLHLQHVQRIDEPDLVLRNVAGGADA